MKTSTVTRALAIAGAISFVAQVSAFTVPSTSRPRLSKIFTATDDDHVSETSSSSTTTRRSILQNAILATASLSLTSATSANAAIGTLPEFSDTNAIFQSITIDVTDKQQFDDTIAFFLNGFDGCKVLRERGGSGGGVVKDTVRLYALHSLELVISGVVFI